MTDVATPLPVPTLAVEYVAYDLLGIDLSDPEKPQVGNTLLLCLQLLANAGVDPAATRLVVTGDFIQSVVNRAATGSFDAEYHGRRNSGSVGGKTMARPDGTVDVLMPAQLFLVGLDEIETQAATDQARRTAFHEAQHVVMHQAGETDHHGFDDKGHGWARMTLLLIADGVIEEYRAEAVCAGIAGSGGWINDLELTVETLVADLRRIAADEYQQHLDVSRLMKEVLEEVQTFWKLLGYTAADIAAGLAVPSATVDHPLWRRVAAPHWADFCRVLSTVPNAQEATDRAKLDDRASALADVLTAWLTTLGFEYADEPDGPAFWIRGWSLLA